jgi:hypothetical protein
MLYEVVGATKFRQGLQGCQRIATFSFQSVGVNCPCSFRVVKGDLCAIYHRTKTSSPTALAVGQNVSLPLCGHFLLLSSQLSCSDRAFDCYSDFDAIEPVLMAVRMVDLMAFCMIVVMAVGWLPVWLPE